jgi:hypothetical protein
MTRRTLPDRKLLPDHIKIGIHEYAMESMSAEEADQKEVLGLCDRFAFIIYVREDLPDSSFAEVLEHEINHACWHAAALKSKAAEETVINRLTPVMIMARRDNPAIYAWIDRAIAQKD